MYIYIYIYVYIVQTLSPTASRLGRRRRGAGSPSGAALNKHILYYTILDQTRLDYTILYYTIQYSIVQYSIAYLSLSIYIYTYTVGGNYLCIECYTRNYVRIRTSCQVQPLQQRDAHKFLTVADVVLCAPYTGPSSCVLGRSVQHRVLNSMQKTFRLRYIYNIHMMYTQCDIYIYIYLFQCYHHYHY